MIFDLGGVILGSPFSGFRDLEQRLGIPERWLAEHVLTMGEDGAFFRLERGDITAAEFAAEFTDETRDRGHEVDGAEVLRVIAEAAQPRPRMLAAVERLRAAGLRVGVITNNWKADDAGWSGLADRFDAFVESAVERIRKPDPRIYEIACERLGVDPGECVFLDDIGTNLKPARAMGMTTIKVGDPDEALAELSDALGFAVEP
ncbi:MAG TPA: HAD family phosphatase [Acidimicrobiia bacterium]|nr:HAD family phosphatase [Acidimicrobiia bacterium]